MIVVAKQTIDYGSFGYLLGMLPGKYSAGVHANAAHFSEVLIRCLLNSPSLSASPSRPSS